MRNYGLECEMGIELGLHNGFGGSKLRSLFYFIFWMTTLGVKRGWKIEDL